MPKYNDIDKKKWRDYTEIVTSSFWSMHRENSGIHNASYHGNFIPQVPRQLFWRYTKKGDWILDPFMGGGTSLIEAQRLGRNSIGVDLLEDVCNEVKERLLLEKNPECSTNIVYGDSCTIDYAPILKSLNIKKVQFVIFHPPYWDIIKFSQENSDLSNSESLSTFLNKFGESIDNATGILENNRYCALIMGDKYANSQIIPLGFLCMNLFIERGFILKAIITKNFDRTKGKIQQQAIWRYRALASDFYIFDHEYIFVFKKLPNKRRKTS